jgi:hypothetical protein
MKFRWVECDTGFPARGLRALESFPRAEKPVPLQTTTFLTGEAEQILRLGGSIQRKQLMNADGR